VDHVDIDDDFFSLGGHSLKATQAVSRVNETFGIHFSVKTLFEYSDLFSFCSQIDQALKMKGWLDIRALEKAINEIVRRHEPLRTFFIKKDRAPVQKIAPMAHIPLNVTNLEKKTDEETQEALAMALAKDAGEISPLQNRP